MRGFTENHPKVAWALEGTARINERLGRHRDALSSYEKALKNRRRGSSCHNFSAEIEKTEAKCAELRIHCEVEGVASQAEPSVPHEEARGAEA